MKRLMQNRKGFTLIEIIVVVVVLAVLMAVAVPSVLKYVNEADDAKYMAEARSIYSVMKIDLAKAVVKSPGGTLNSSEIEDVLRKCNISGTLSVVGVQIDKTEISVDNLPDEYYIMFGNINVDENKAENGKYAIVRENQEIEITNEEPTRNHFVEIETTENGG